ncbi:MAG: hypothetical protein NTY98_02535 [Verrucomicrobia bacterium]|nr:hypothetical protein [Verrucomicrobiota bacterium]
MTRLNLLQCATPRMTGHFPAAVSASAIADAWSLIYRLGTWLPAIRPWQKNCTDAARLAQPGNMGDLMVLPVFNAPALPVGLEVNDGALNCIFDHIQRVKSSSTYTEAIGTDLGVVGSKQSSPEFATLQPTIAGSGAGPNKVDIHWGRGGHAAFQDACGIPVDRGNGWTLLTIDRQPPIPPRSRVGNTAPSTMLTTPKSASGVRNPASPLAAENYSPKSK